MILSEREKFIILVDNDRLKKSDAIVLLEGDGLNRVKKVAELYKEGWGEKIVFSGGISDLKYGSFPFQYVMPELEKYGIKKENLILEVKSQNTKDQAENVIQISLANNWERIILVASHYHQYRAYLTFMKAMQEAGMLIEIINFTSQNLQWFEETGWGKRFDLLQQEFIKIEKYSDLGHLSTFEEAIEYQKWKEEQV